MQEAINSWSSSRGYDAKTGKTTGGAIYYKQMVEGGVSGVGCAVQKNCPNKGAVVVCTFDRRITAEPAYPVFVKEEIKRKNLETAVLNGLNKLRAGATPKPKKPLAPLVWNAQLAEAARVRVREQSGGKPKYDKNLKRNTCRLRFRKSVKVTLYSVISLIILLSNQTF